MYTIHLLQYQKVELTLEFHFISVVTFFFRRLMCNDLRF